MAAGFPETTPHQLRHLHATQLIELGRPITEAQDPAAAASEIATELAGVFAGITYCKNSVRSFALRFVHSLLRCLICFDDPYYTYLPRN